MDQRTWVGMSTTIQTNPEADVVEATNPLGALSGYLETFDTRLTALEAQSNNEHLLTAADAAGYAQATVGTIHRAVRAGDLAAAGYVGRSPRLRREDVDRWLAGQKPAPSPAANAPSRRRVRARARVGNTVETAWSQLG